MKAPQFGTAGPFAALLLFFPSIAPNTARAQDWTSYGGDPGGMKYSPLREVNRANVTELKPAWIFHTGDVSDGDEMAHAKFV